MTRPPLMPITNTNNPSPQGAKAAAAAAAAQAQSEGGEGQLGVETGNEGVAEFIAVPEPTADSGWQ